MLKIAFSRPTTYLIVLTISALTLSDCNSSFAVQAADTIQLDTHILPVLFAPMSQLVQPPYASAQSFANPLDVEQADTARGEAMLSMASQSEPQEIESPTITFALNASQKEPSQRSTALPQALDFTLNAPMSTRAQQTEDSLSERAPFMGKNSLAMIGR